MAAPLKKNNRKAADMARCRISPLAIAKVHLGRAGREGEDQTQTLQ